MKNLARKITKNFLKKKTPKKLKNYKKNFAFITPNHEKY